MKKALKIKLIFGLGNPGKNFINTPHNFGRDLLETFITKNLAYANNNFQLAYYKDNLLLAISQRYMNESGLVLKEILAKFKITTQETLIIHDEADLPFLWLKLTFNKYHAMHKGVESIYKYCHQNIWRLRIGIQGSKRQKAEKIILKKLTGEKLRIWLKAQKKFVLLLDQLSLIDIQKISVDKLFFIK
jgi:PTH1 family peptidyl-tRNA hydrolase